ncbi:MAG: Unknown protein [uncultured Sulfurovum sp.]|uniref:Uncharacterized protein n=1 Tax=uncultured Sulfurovum sp. TaxID=269237 RepID=A0A6S6U7W5_9BACT|nr:MAG: Unknown protein [uncultured Sulfurovum sp.]
MLSLPTSKILHVYPEQTPTIELYKRHGIGNILGQPSDSEKDKARNEAKNMLIRDARNADILNRATEQAKKYIEEYVISFGYTVKFVQK